MTKTFIYSLSGKEEVSKSLLFQYSKFKKWAWYGDLGYGKTTLIKSCIKILGSPDEGSSPTFSIVNQYQSPDQKPILHIDLYRLKDLKEVFNAGIYDLIHDDGYCFVEWPALIEEWMDKDWLKLKINLLDEELRMIEVHS